MPGSCDARSLNPCHTKWLVQYGQPASCFVRAYTAVCHVCPLAHCHHTLFPLAAVTLSGVRSPFRSAAHSSRRCILPVLRQYVYKDSLMIPHSSASLNSLLFSHASYVSMQRTSTGKTKRHFHRASISLTRLPQLRSMPRRPQGSVKSDAHGLSRSRILRLHPAAT